MKRAICLLLSVVLLLAAMPVQAADESKVSQICQAIVDDHANILRYTDLSSLAGRCGLMASWQMYILGINSWVIGHHGKDQYDAYKDITVTSGGHRAKAYSARDYTLEEALNTASKNGTWDVYNILVGFQQTNTQQGSVYGHSVVIYGILDGVVYYTEGYNTPMGRAGTPYRLTIREFAEYYAPWTVFEGIVVFGKKGYIANCTEYATNLYAQALEQTPLYSQPCQPGTADAGSELLRTVPAGERLWVNALWENPQGELYYQADDGYMAGYIQAEAVQPIHFVYTDIGITNAQIPADLEEGDKLTGRIASEYSAIDAVWVEVTDPQGQVLLNHGLAKLSGVYDLESDTFSKVVNLRSLEAGNYIFNIHADGLNHYVRNGRVVADRQQRHLVQSPFRVGQTEAFSLPEPVPETEIPDGWIWKNGTWYYYKQGVPRTGWYCSDGADYYLRPDGSVTTGWAKINGKLRYFSNTGCMRTGWILGAEGQMYLMPNGAPATGWCTVDGQKYRFDEKGILQERIPGP